LSRREDMRRGIAVASLVAALAIVLAVLPALAAPKQDVYIEAPTIIVPGGADPAPFTASGAAVGGVLSCATGTVFTGTITSSGPYGPPTGEFLILSMEKEFVLGDGSGTFVVQLTVKLYLSGPKAHYTYGSWKVVRGTGNYASLKGNGKLEGIPINPGFSILDVYDGKLK
jgi:hypothetical protein